MVSAVNFTSMLFLPWSADCFPSFSTSQGAKTRNASRRKPNVSSSYTGVFHLGSSLVCQYYLHPFLQDKRSVSITHCMLTSIISSDYKLLINIQNAAFQAGMSLLFNLWTRQRFPPMEVEEIRADAEHVNHCMEVLKICETRYLLRYCIILI